MKKIVLVLGVLVLGFIMMNAKVTTRKETNMYSRMGNSSMQQVSHEVEETEGSLLDLFN